MILVSLFSDFFENTNKFVQIRYDDDRAQDNNLLQKYLRAGMTDPIDKLEFKDIANSKFYIDMRLSESNCGPKLIKPKWRKTITDMTMNGIEEMQEMIDVECATPTDKRIFARSKTEPKLMSNIIINEEDIGSKSISNMQRADTVPARDPFNKITDYNSYNATLTVNTLHLAIISRQKSSVEKVLKKISDLPTTPSPEGGNSLLDILYDEVILQKYKTENSDIRQKLDENKFNVHDRLLHGMTALHLACQFYPEAVELIFNAIYKTEISLDEVSKLTIHNGNCLQYTPLHLASKLSLLEPAR